LSNFPSLKLTRFFQINFSDQSDSNIPANLRKTVYCTAIAAGDEKEWNFLWEQYLKSNNANEKSNILKALACSREIWILQVNLTL
jgi:aminopeptidase N